MNILFCGNKGVCKGIFLSALSLCKNTECGINFYILTAALEDNDAIPQSFADDLACVLREKNEKHNVFLFDITKDFIRYLPLANMGTNFTPFCMLRLFADTVKEIPDKILYLDADVLCRCDFTQIYDINMGKFDIAGVPDRYGKWFFGNVFKHDYLNSGVLLLNMENIRENGLFEKCRKMCRDKKMFMPDQSALNILAVKRKLPGKYNNQGKIKKDTVFKHFTTFFKFFPKIRTVTIKPWHIEKMHNELKIFEFDDILFEYQRRKQNDKRNSDFLYNR